MNRDEFIDCLLSMYPKSFENNSDMWRNVYEQALPADIDFDELFDWFLVNYNNSSVAPGTGVFKPFVEKHAHNKQERQKQAQQKEALESWKQLKKEIAAVDNEPVEYDLLEPLDLLKKLYTKPEVFIQSMKARQNALPRFVKRGFIFFLNEEMKAFREYVATLPHEKLKIIFWRKTMKIIGSEDKFNELCRDM